MLRRLRSWPPAAEPDQPRCPQCFNHVLFGRPACLRCARPLPPIFDVPERPRLVPLTRRQRRRLRLSALLVAFGPLSLWMGLGLFFFIQEQTWDTFPMFTLIGLLMVAIAVPLAWRSWSDAGGEALLQPAYLLDLISVKRSSSHAVGSSVFYYAAFSQLGRFEVSKEDFDRLALGERYQLTYSPRSGKLWSFRLG